MGRAPCCEKVGLNRGAWTREEDLKLMQHIATHGEGSWRTLPKAAGLLRCGKSCRLRWINYLRPDLKRGNITEEEDRLIIKLHSVLGNRWSLIARRLPGRTDNEIKNHWNTHLRKKLKGMGIDPCTHEALERVDQAGYNTMNNYQKQRSSILITPSAASMRYNNNNDLALAGPSSASNNNNINTYNINSPGPSACVNPHHFYDNYSRRRLLISTNPATNPQHPRHLAPFVTSNPAPNCDYKAKPMFYIDSDALKRLRSPSEDTALFHVAARAPAAVGPSPSTHTHCSTSGISSSSPSPSPSSAHAIVSNINTTTLQYCSSNYYTRISENDDQLEDYSSLNLLGDCSLLKPINLESNHEATNVEFMEDNNNPSVLSLLENDLTWDFDMVMHPMEEGHVPTPTHEMLQTLWGPSSWLSEQQEELI